MLNLFGLKIHLYGLLIGIGVWAAYEISLWRKKESADKKFIENIIYWAVIGGVVGARVYHVVDFWQRYYSQNLIKIFYVWEGGLGIWGALVGGFVGIYLYCLRNKANLMQTLDSLIVGVPLAQAIGRLGNFVNGELYGKNGEPLFAYEAVLSVVLFMFLWDSSTKQPKSGVLTGIYLMGYGTIRILLEGMRSDEIIWKIGGFPVAIIFGITSVLLGIVLVLKRFDQRNESRS